MKKRLTGFSLIIATVFFACKKESTIPDRFTPNPSNNANIKFLNMAPGVTSVNFFANDIKISGANASSTGAVNGLGYPAIFPSAIGYSTISSGTVKIDAKITDSAAVNPKLLVLSNTQAFNAGKFYTFALVDTLPQATALVVEDDPGIPDATKAYLRVANFAADSAVSILVTKTSLDYPYSKTYNTPAKTILPFDSLGAGTGQVYSVIFKRNSNNAVLGTITNFAPSPTKKYTFYVRGLLRTFGTSGGFGSYTNF